MTAGTGRAFAAALIAAALLGGCGGSETSTQPLLAPTDEATTATEGAEAGRAATPPLHHACEGSGSPTVVLEAGLGSPSEGWTPLQRELSGLTRVCRYDRAGLGRSPLPADADARTAGDQVGDLARLLDREGIEPPYVIVGHSYGGVLARLFAHRHRADVAGIVLVDTPHPDERDRYLQALPDGDDDPVVARLRAQLTAPFGPETNPERLDWDASMVEARAARRLGDLPLVVITAGRAGPRAVADLDRRLADELEAVRMELQGELALLAGGGVHVVAEESGHAVPDPESGQPQVIVTAVQALVRSARLHVPLVSCEAVFTAPRTRCVDAR